MQTVLFDLDGTLIDHFTTIWRCVNHAERELGLPQSPYETVRTTVGGSVPVTLGRLLGEERVEAALPLFIEHFEAIQFEDLVALPGADWILESLKSRGHTLAVFTNKLGDHSRAALRHLGLDRWIDAIVGTGDTPYRKPEPEFTRYMLERLQTTAGETALIGDSPFDYASAQAGPMPCYLVATGSHSIGQLQQETGADGVFPDLYTLGEAVFQLPRAIASV